MPKASVLRRTGRMTPVRTVRSIEPKPVAVRLGLGWNMTQIVGIVAIARKILKSNWCCRSIEILELGGEFWEAVTGFRNQNRIPFGAIALKGRIKTIMHDSIGVDYGIESYFIPEGYRLPEGKISVEVAVNSSYQGVIKNILVDGKIIDLRR